MPTGAAGIPFAIPFDRDALVVGQLLFATTDTTLPFGIELPNVMLHVVDDPTTTAPGAVVLHV